MSLGKAVALMESSVDIHDWNQKRQLLKYNVEPGLVQQLLIYIDAYGLCPKVAKMNGWVKR